MSESIELKFFAYDLDGHDEPIEIHDGKSWSGKISQKDGEEAEFQIEVDLSLVSMTATHLRLTGKMHYEPIPPNGHHCEGGGFQFVLGCPEGTTVERIE